MTFTLELTVLFFLNILPQVKLCPGLFSPGASNGYNGVGEAKDETAHSFKKANVTMTYLLPAILSRQPMS